MSQTRTQHFDALKHFILGLLRLEPSLTSVCSPMTEQNLGEGALSYVLHAPRVLQ